MDGGTGTEMLEGYDQAPGVCGYLHRAVVEGADHSVAGDGRLTALPIAASAVGSWRKWSQMMWSDSFSGAPAPPRMLPYEP
jgi:hypothetical protein